MKIVERNGKQYRLPNRLNDFQRDMYIHLIDWKWKRISKEPGYYRSIPYDAILPDAYRSKFPVIYPTAVDRLRKHHKRYPFRIHKFFNHMASSQAANVNLFLPILFNPEINPILQQLKPDLSRVATEELDQGYRLEYWDEPFNNLKDHSKVAGTDSDIAIAYYDNKEKLCLWLIEHKLTESEFTTCGGFTSKGRTSQHNCNKSMEEILKDKATCYYHSAKRFNYWNLMEDHHSIFLNHPDYDECPFKGGMNQLWRNLLMAISIEKDDRMPFNRVYFSVVRHPENVFLDETINRFRKLIDGSPMFSVFTSRDVLAAAKSGNNSDLAKWIDWYKGLYLV